MSLWLLPAQAWSALTQLQAVFVYQNNFSGSLPRVSGGRNSASGADNGRMRVML